MPTAPDPLKQFIEQHCLKTGKEFTLSTGAKADFYFDCKAATLNGEMLAEIADRILDIADQIRPVPTAIAGLTMGADPLVAAVAVRAFQRGSATRNACIVRKEPKQHGTRNHIENDLGTGTNVLVVDDVITTGSSTAKACEHLKEAGYNIVGIVAVVDREAGGKQSLQDKYDCEVLSLFGKQDFMISDDENDDSGHPNSVAATA